MLIYCTDCKKSHIDPLILYYKHLLYNKFRYINTNIHIHTNVQSRSHRSDSNTLVQNTLQLLLFISVSVLLFLGEVQHMMSFSIVHNSTSSHLSSSESPDRRIPVLRLYVAVWGVILILQALEPLGGHLVPLLTGLFITGRLILR